MQTSLQGIANKARRDKRYRFRDLGGMLSEEALIDTWKLMNRKAAPGIDRQTAQEYEKDLATNVQDLVSRLKGKRYRARLVKRVYIPKADGKLRPLGLPVVEDKLVQATVARILSAIYEVDFLPCSFGYRPKTSARDALKSLTKTLYGRLNFVVEADIKGFFDNIDHAWLIQMLERRVDDRGFIRLIKKWLNAGVLEPEGNVIHPVTGTPQGGVISPILANIYLHYVLDLWFEKVVKPRCRGEAYLCRYADDFVCAFQYKDDADRFYRVLPKRLAKFGLSLAADKTRILEFSRFQTEDGFSFDFLGFEFRWIMGRKLKPIIQRRTSRKKFRQSLKNFTSWCKDNRSLRMPDLFSKLNAKLRGYYQYYGMIGNYRSLSGFFYHVVRGLFRWLNRRSQRRSYTWPAFLKLLKDYALERPRITEHSDRQMVFAWN